MTTYVDPKDVVDTPQYVNPADINFGTPDHAGMEHTSSMSPRAPRKQSSIGDVWPGFKQGLGNIQYGATQRAMELTGNPRAGFMRQALRNERRATSENELLNGAPSLASDIGVMSGEIAPSIPLMPLSGGSSLVPTTLTAFGLGSLYSSLFPSVSSQETTTNAIMGGAGAGVGNVLSRVVLPTSARTMTNAQKDVLNVAKREGIPLRTSEATGSAAIKNFEQMAANRPATAGMEQRFNEVQTKAINEAISRRFGAPVSELGPAERAAAQTKIGNELKSLIAGRQVRLDTDLVNSVAAMDQKYSAGGRLTMSPEMQRILDNALSESYRGQVSGETAQSIRSILLGKMRDAAKAENSELADVYRTLADGLNKAIKGSMSPADAKEWSAANRRYMNFKIYEDSLIPSPTEAAGDVPINRLAAALERNRPNSYFQGKNQDYADLARLGQIIKPPGRSALLGAQGLPIARNVDDVIRASTQPILQSEFIQNYLTGMFPGQMMLRDNPLATNMMDTALRTQGLAYANEQSKKNQQQKR
jgi:hypothetical protein